jgi:putative oxidoreductase
MSNQSPREIPVLESCTAPDAAWVPRTPGVPFAGHAELKILIFTPPGGRNFSAALGFRRRRPTSSQPARWWAALRCFSVFRWAALSLIPILLGAIGLVHLPMAFFFSNPHGGWEFRAPWAIALAGQARLDDGAFALPVRFAGVPRPG